MPNRTHIFGLLLCFAIAGLSFLAKDLFGLATTEVTALLLGLGVANFFPLGEKFAPGIQFSEKKTNSLQRIMDLLTEAYRLLKDDGRIALNIPYEINRQKKGGRIFFVSEMWQIMKQIGFGFFGIVDLEEQSPHRSKTTAWGSWMSPSSPYIYNPKECVVLAYKKQHIKKIKGQPQWTGELTEIEKEDGSKRNKMVYEENDKKEFMELVFGQWNYFADTKSLTKATFSMDIPTKAIKILSYKNDIVMDPFSGSGTSLVAAEVLGRRWLGIELSENYAKIAQTRVDYFKTLDTINEIPQ